MHIVKH